MIVDVIEEKGCILFSIGVRAGGSRGTAAPPNFGQLGFFGQQEKIWAKPGFKDVSMFFFNYFEEINIFYFNLKKNPEVGVMSFCLLGKGIIC